MKKNEIIKYILNSSDKIKFNSKDIKKDDIFIALQGKKKHGNLFLNDSIIKGAKYCITDKKINLKEKKEKVIIVHDLFNFLKKICKEKLNSYNGKVIGITGSAGKTTLKETLSFFLKKKYKISFSKKSYNNLLGLIISILNLDLNSKYAIFELGTNNFGEIKKLVQLLKPSQVFVTNIQSTHLESFKNKINIAKEKSNIFNKIYNPNVKTLYLHNVTDEEKYIYKKAIKEKIKKIIQIQNKNIKKVKKINKNYKFKLFFKNKEYNITFNLDQDYRIKNLLFCIAFFSENKIPINIIMKNYKKVLPVLGRGKVHNLNINKNKIKLIDDSYNANPDTMLQSIKYLNSIKSNVFLKILILGDMNELGFLSNEFHKKVIKAIEQYKFNFVILSGKLMKRAISNYPKTNNKFVYKANSKSILKYIKEKVDNKAIILVKCSNSTEVNNFAKNIVKIYGGIN